MNCKYSFLLLIVVLCAVLLSTVYSLAVVEDGKFFGKYPIPKKTPQPINIDSEKVKNMSLDSNLYVIGYQREEVELMNTGKSLELHASKDSKSYVRAFGEVYKFYKIIYFFASSVEGTAGTTVDGKGGYPLEIHVFFCNEEKYGSIKNALEQRDGCLDILFPIKITKTLDNPVYPPFNITVARVKKAGSSSKTELDIAIQWYGIFPKDTTFHIYPGSLPDVESGKEYYCTTTIMLPNHPNMFISPAQFLPTFGSLEDANGNRLVTAQRPKPNGETPVLLVTDSTIYNILVK